MRAALITVGVKNHGQVQLKMEGCRVGPGNRGHLLSGLVSCGARERAAESRRRNRQVPGVVQQIAGIEEPALVYKPNAVLDMDAGQKRRRGDRAGSNR